MTAMRKERVVEPLALHVDVVAEMLGISPSGVRLLVKDGTLPHIRLRRRVLIPKVAVLKLLEAPAKAPRKVRRTVPPPPVT